MDSHTRIIMDLVFWEYGRIMLNEPCQERNLKSVTVHFDVVYHGGTLLLLCLKFVWHYWMCLFHYSPKNDNKHLGFKKVLDSHTYQLR